MKHSENAKYVFISPGRRLFNGLSLVQVNGGGIISGTRWALPVYKPQYPQNEKLEEPRLSLALRIIRATFQLQANFPTSFFYLM